MARIYHALMLLITGATDKELARHVRYLKAENEILRSKLPTRVVVTTKERGHLIRFAEKLGGALDSLVTIVHPDTIRRWIREDRKSAKRARAKVGRRKTNEEKRALILKLAKENDGWGYTRIMSEMKKLGVKPPSRNTVKNILKENGFDTSPKRGKGTWDEFLKQHAETLWQCDFLQVRSLTAQGLRDLFLIVFIHVESRRVVITPSTPHPDDSWVRTQAESFIQQLPAEQKNLFHIQHDRDKKFTTDFDATLKAAGAVVIKSQFRSPNLNAYVERFIQTLEIEAIDHFIILGQKHLDHITQTFCRFYNQLRPHQSKENAPLPNASLCKLQRRAAEKELTDAIAISEVGCEKQLGGVLKHYYRKAA